jgi:hypothetical protein
VVPRALFCAAPADQIVSLKIRLTRMQRHGQSSKRAAKQTDSLTGTNLNP